MCTQSIGNLHSAVTITMILAWVAMVRACTALCGSSMKHYQDSSKYELLPVLVLGRVIDK